MLRDRTHEEHESTVQWVGGHYDPAAFDPKKVSAFLTQYKAPAPDANAPFAAAIDQAKREGKSVFVWFSAPW